MASCDPHGHSDLDLEEVISNYRDAAAASCDQQVGRMSAVTSFAAAICDSDSDATFSSNST